MYWSKAVSSLSIFYRISIKIFFCSGGNFIDCRLKLSLKLHSEYLSSIKLQLFDRVPWFLSSTFLYVSWLYLLLWLTGEVTSLLPKKVVLYANFISFFFNIIFGLAFFLWAFVWVLLFSSPITLFTDDLTLNDDLFDNL